MPGDEGSTLPTDGDLADVLSTLRRTGSNLLVVGAVTDEAAGHACRRLLGADDGTDCRRLLVCTDADADRATARLPCADAGDVTVIDHAAPSRGAAAGRTAPAATDAGPSTGPGSPGGPAGPSGDGTGAVADREVDATDPAALGTAVVGALDDLDADALDPAELRVCVDSLVPLLEGAGEEATFRLLHAVTGRVRQLEGMGHYHLPVARDDETVRLLAPLFDAVVELRTDDGATRQRWHVREADVSTDWLPVGE